jgi:hypothetical protein
MTIRRINVPRGMPTPPGCGLRDAGPERAYIANKPWLGRDLVPGAESYGVLTVVDKQSGADPWRVEASGLGSHRSRPRPSAQAA